MASGKVLDVPAGAQAPGVNIQQFQDGGQMCFNRCWRVLTDAGEIDDQANLTDGLSIRIQSLCNGLFLQPQSPGGEPSLIMQAADSGNDDQGWRLVGSNAGFKIQPLLNASLALDLPGVGLDDHIPIQVFHDNGGGFNQQWVFV